MGRPTKLDDIRAKKIVDAIARGCSRTAAAGAACISRASLMDWLARGRDGEQPFADFLDRVKKAEADAEEAMVTVVREAAPKSWQAAAWWLERARPQDWARREPTPEQESERSEGETQDDVVLFESMLAAAKSRKVG